MPLLPARVHRQAVAELPLDILVSAMGEQTQLIELRLAATKAAPRTIMGEFRAGPPKASFEMADSELETAIAREKEHLLRTNPAQQQIRMVSSAPRR